VQTHAPSVSTATRAARAACGILVVLVALALLRRAFAGVDLRATLHALEGAGRWAPLAFLPFLAMTALDATGVRILLGTLGRTVPLGRFLPIRIATEALHMTAPAGFLVADSVTAALLDSRCGVPLAEGAVIAVARKWLVMRAHAIYIALGALCGGAILGTASEHFFGQRWLPWAVAASGLVPLGLSLGVGTQFHGEPAFARLHGALSKIAWAPLRERMARSRRSAAKVDSHLTRIGEAGPATWLAAVAFLGAWLFESVETCVLVWLVGGRLDFGFAMAVEVGISLVRSIANVAPAGLGVQDAGYAVLLQATGLPANTSAAFVLLKRGKEVVWIAAGYTLLAAMRRSPIADGTQAVPAAAGSALLVGRVA
jgi:hypothetical protein